MLQLHQTKGAWPRKTQIRVAELLDGQLVKFYSKEGKISGDREDYISDNVIGLLNTLGNATLHGILIGSEHCTVNDYGTDSELILTDMEQEDIFLNDDVFTTYSEMFHFKTPPIFLKGVFNACLAKQFSVGQTTVAPGSTIRTPFKERLGIVITPLKETYSTILQGRLIGKVYNPAYEVLHEIVIE